LFPSNLPASAGPPLVLEEIDIFSDGDFLLAPLTIGNKQCLFVLDTGSESSVFDSSLLSGTSRGTVKVTTPDGVIDLKLFDAPPLFLGRTRLVGKPQVVGADLSNMRETQGHNIRGILGMDVLQQHVVRVDFDKGKLYFQQAVGPTTSTPVPLFYQSPSPLPYVRMKLAGLDLSLYFRIDTGMFSSGSIRKETADELVRKRRAVWWYDAHATALSGGSLRPVWRIDEAELQDWKHALFLREGDSNSLGLDYLSRFNITFDFPKGMAYFSKSQNYDRQTRPNMTGIRVVRKGGRIVVQTVTAKSAGAAADLRAGDEIVSIGGYTISQARLKLVDDLLSANVNAVSLRISRNGQLFDVSLPRHSPQ